MKPCNRDGHVLKVNSASLLRTYLFAALGASLGFYIVATPTPVVAETAARLPAGSADREVTPSKLDYVVLASLADSSGLLSSSTTYRAPVIVAVEPKKAATASAAR